MRVFKETDFQPMEQFSLSWRWTDERWNKLPPDHLTQIRPFTATKAAELFQIAKELFSRDGLNVELFDIVARFDDRSSLSEDEARRWLQEMLRVNEPVIVLWDDDLAVLTSTEVFCRYWDDFCYPISHNVHIWPPENDWALFYWREEQFRFGRLKPVNVQRAMNEITAVGG